MSIARLAVSLPLVVSLLLVSQPSRVYAQAQPQPSAQEELSRDQMRQFLLKAKIIRSRDIGKGVTHPYRLTLTDGTLTHDAAFQSVDEQKSVANLQGSGRGPRVELNFVDAYRYNLAAEAMATLVGLEYMMPVHVEREWNRKKGSLSWWVDTMMEEGERLKKNIKPPDAVEWNNQMYRMRVFSSLTRDTDRNLGNVLITHDWKVVMIDFTRAFRLQAEISNPRDLAKCDRTVLARMEQLTKESIKKAVGEYLLNSEIDSVLKRRDLLVAHFKKMVAEKGEAEVLY
ncbi:MAG: hypothetical protein ACRD2N_04350 [Vicinamibacterales bacterium]